MPLPTLKNWETTRDALHQIALVVGAIRVACSDPLPNDLHFSLDLTATGFSTKTMRCGGVLHFDLNTLRMSFTRCDKAVFTLDIGGHSQISLTRKLLAIFADCGYSITPSMKLITHDANLDIDSALAQDYMRTLDGVYTALARFRAKLSGFMTPLVLWPHHFDMAFIWFLTGATDEHSDPQIAFGFAPFSDGLDRPYIYAYAWSKPTGYVHVPLEAAARAITEGYTGLYAAYDDLYQLDDTNSALEAMLLSYQALASAQFR